MKLKRIASLVIAMIMTLSIMTIPAFASPQDDLSGSLANFTQKNTYTNGMFSDVPSGAWHEAHVKNVYELGIMEGKGSNKFDPEGNLTVAEAVVMAVRTFCIHFQLEEPSMTGASPWYANHLALAKKYEIVTEDFEDYSVAITRADYAQILRNAGRNFRDGVIKGLYTVSWVPDNAIPDVQMTDKNAEAIYKLYRGGILTGSDSKGTFYPEAQITRAAAAAIISRLASQEMRLQSAVKLGYTTILTYAEQTTIAIGEETKVIALVVPCNTLDYDIQTASYKSSDPSIATVTEDGIVTGVANGTVTITVSHEAAPEEFVTIEVDENHSPATWYYGGEYVVGKDIPAGLYWGTGVEYIPKAFYTFKTEEGPINFSFATSSGFNVFELKNGQHLKITSTGKCVAHESRPNIEPNSQGFYPPGVYLVGEDIPAGTYQFYGIRYNASIPDAYIELYRDISGNDYFENGKADAYGTQVRTVKNGELLSIKLGYFKAVEP